MDSLAKRFREVLALGYNQFKSRNNGMSVNENATPSAGSLSWWSILDTLLKKQKLVD
ncbi:predicted protein [Sclerotinia sclerotiorum 1980 UF-70]|uniref:Uncharacterized protein n=1 Tax=Sclerotinia sclerotiorum (strain ATCC 18683 / 1980 / Ss-1) TaxID=665079 RepID=A7E714_SCLS1|nr:predicted protein [Sclerotinia sclerotiorum 1980 UF-70]EDN96166.1 predicted protein [Sclerotinia sclerotiorum 1980 UF-70]